MQIRSLLFVSLLYTNSLIAGQMGLPYGPSVKTITPQPFTAIEVQFNVNMDLHTGYNQPLVVFHGDSRDLKCITTEVKNGKLYIHAPRGRPKYGPVSASIHTRYLNGFEYHGKGTITAPHLKANLVSLRLDNQGKTTLNGIVRLGEIHLKGSGYTEINGATSPRLSVYMCDHAKLKITGIVALRHIKMTGDTWFSARWIKNPTLTVRLHDKAYLQLAGIVNKMDVKLTDASRFNGRYLRPRRSYVKTFGMSVAEIITVSRQHTLASDSSDIFYYGLPHMKTDFMAHEGSVLDTRTLNAPFVEEPTVYNKDVARG